MADTKGTLLWPDDTGSRAPLVVVTSEQVSNEYLAYLSRRHISWIVCGKTHIDLARACEILNREFGVERMAIVGGGARPYFCFNHTNRGSTPGALGSRSGS